MRVNTISIPRYAKNVLSTSYPSIPWIHSLLESLQTLKLELQENRQNSLSKSPVPLNLLQSSPMGLWCHSSLMVIKITNSLTSEGNPSIRPVLISWPLFFFLFLLICASMYVFVCVCLHVQSCVCLQREARGRFESLPHLLLHLTLGDRVSHSLWSLLTWLGWLVIWTPDLLLSLFPHRWHTGVHHHAWLLKRTGYPSSLSWLHISPAPNWKTNLALEKQLLQAGGLCLYFSPVRPKASKLVTVTCTSTLQNGEILN